MSKRRRRRKTYSCWWYDDDPKRKYVYEPGTVGHWLELNTNWVDDLVGWLDNGFIAAMEWWRNLPGFRKLSDDTCACIAYTGFVGGLATVMVILSVL